MADIPEAPAGLHQLILGGHEAATTLIDDPRIALISATGSTRMGRAVAPRLAQRFARGLFELGGNNGMIVSPTADLDMAVRAILFAAVGTAGQRCTSTRRLFLHRGIAAEMKRRLVNSYGSIRIGDPMEHGTLMGPLIDRTAVDNMMAALERVKAESGRILYGGHKIDRPGFFVEPTLVEVPKPLAITCEETFAPILYVFEFGDLDEAIRIHNDVPQGLSSAIFTPTSTCPSKRIRSGATRNVGGLPTSCSSAPQASVTGHGSGRCSSNSSV